MQAGRRVVKTAIAGAFHASGALVAFQRARRLALGARVHVLAFHRVVERLDRLPADVIPSLAITTASLRQLCLLARERFEVLPLAEAARVVAGERRSRRDVLALTFDDGYRDVVQHALPVLRELGLPATVFVPTGFIGSEEPLLHDRLYALLRRVRLGGRDLCAARVPARLRRALASVEGQLLHGGDDAPAATLDALIARLPEAGLRRTADALEELLGERLRPDPGGRVMSAAELRQCADAGLDLGAHTIGHVALVREPPGRVTRELVQPRRELEAIAGRPCGAFAFCNGLWSPSLVAAVRNAGYRVAVTTCDRPNRRGDDPLLLGRKVLWEGHAQGALGRSRALLAAHLVDLFGALGLSTPRASGELHLGDEELPWSLRA